MLSDQLFGNPLEKTGKDFQDDCSIPSTPFKITILSEITPDFSETFKAHCNDCIGTACNVTGDGAIEIIIDKIMDKSYKHASSELVYQPEAYNFYSTKTGRMAISVLFIFALFT